MCNQSNGSRWATAEEDHTRCRSCQLRTRNRRQFAQAHQNWTTEDWKIVAWSDEFQFLLQHSDARVRIWCKEHERMDPSCLVTTVRAGGGGVLVRGIFSWHTLGLLVPIEHRLNATAYRVLLLTMYTPLWLQCTHILMATSSRKMHHFTKLKSSQTGFLNMTMSSLYSNGLHIHQISIQKLTNFQQLRDAIMLIWTKNSEECFQHLVESMPRRIKAVMKA